MNFLFTLLSFERDVFAGIENSVYNLALGLMAENKVIVYTSFLSGASAYVEGVQVIRSNNLPQNLPVGDSARDGAILQHCKTFASHISQEILGIIKENNIDILISFDHIWGITHEIEFYKICPIPIILSLHVFSHEEILCKISHADYLFVRVVSETFKAQLGRIIPQLKTKVIPNSVDTVAYSHIKSCPESKFLFVNSRIDRGKGHCVLLRAFAQSAMRCRGFKLGLCTGPFPFGYQHEVLPEILKLSTSLELSDCIVLLPAMSWNTVKDTLAKSFAVVLPSMYETFGRAALEAMAAGVPVICSDGGHLPTLVQSAALVYQREDQSQLTAALDTLVVDRETYHRLQIDGRVRAKAFENRTIAAQLVREVSAALNGWTRLRDHSLR